MIGDREVIAMRDGTIPMSEDAYAQTSQSQEGK